MVAKEKANFICINQVRILASTIKRYRPYGTNRLDVYFSSSRSKIEKEEFVFDSEDEREDVLALLDLHLLWK